MFSFQSDLTDPDTALVDMGTRWYDPYLGRFTSRDVLFGDPMSPMSLNQHVYGADNPVSMIDPDGLCPRDPDNQYGCGYTIASRGKSKRHDHTFGRVHWWVHWRPLLSTRGWDATPPPPPRPPTVMLNKTSAVSLQTWANRANRLAAIDEGRGATKAELDAVADKARPKGGGCGFLGLKCVGRTLWEYRWQIVAVASVVACSAASAGTLTAGCGAAAVGIMAAGKELEIIGHEALAPGGPRMDRFLKNSAFNAATSAYSLPISPFGQAFNFACAGTNWCSNPYYDDPLVEGDEGLFD